MDNKILNNIGLVNELSLNACPSLQTQLYDGWVLRFTNGITYRGNSISPIYTGNLEYAEKINYCEERYISQGLPVVYRISENTDKKLDFELERYGYNCEYQINVMICDVSKNNYEKTNVVIEYELEDKWVYGVFKDCSDTKKIETFIAIHKNILLKKIYASIELDGKLIANGVGVIERGYIGLFDIGVNEKYRQNGLGYSICIAILSEAQKFGVNNAYIEVNSSNEPAIGLYKKLGCENLYKYWYRVKK